MARIIALLGELLLRLGKAIFGLAASMPLLVASITLATATFLAAGSLSDAGLSSLRQFAQVEPKAWCLATAFGVDLAIYWLIEGVMAALAIYVYLNLKEPIMRASAKLKEVISK